MLMGPMMVGSFAPGSGTCEKCTFRSRPPVGDPPRAMYCEKMSRGRTPRAISAPEVPDERRGDVTPRQRIRRRHRLALLAETAVETAHDLLLAIEDREPLLDVTRQARVGVELDDAGGARA